MNNPTTTINNPTTMTAFSHPDQPALNPPQPTHIGVIANGLLQLSSDELAELDRIITPRAAHLLVKAFGAEILTLIGPLYLQDHQETQANQPEILSEQQLKDMIRDPAYWRDHNPEMVHKVQQGFAKLYPNV